MINHSVVKMEGSRFQCSSGRRGQWQQQRSRCRMIEWFGESLIVMASRSCVGFVGLHQGCFASCCLHLITSIYHIVMPFFVLCLVSVVECH